MAQHIIYGEFKQGHLTSISSYTSTSDLKAQPNGIPLMEAHLSDLASGIVGKIVTEFSRNSEKLTPNGSMRAHRALDEILGLTQYLNPANEFGLSGEMKLTTEYKANFPTYDRLEATSELVSLGLGDSREIVTRKDNENISTLRHQMFTISGLKNNHLARLQIGRLAEQESLNKEKALKKAAQEAGSNRDKAHLGQGLIYESVNFMDKMLYTGNQVRKAGRGVSITIPEDHNLLFPVYHNAQVYGTFEQGHYNQLFFGKNGSTDNIPTNARLLVNVPDLTFLPGVRTNLNEWGQTLNTVPPGYSTTQNLMTSLIVSLDIDQAEGRIKFQETDDYTSFFNSHTI